MDWRETQQLPTHEAVGDAALSSRPSSRAVHRRRTRRVLLIVGLLIVALVVIADRITPAIAGHVVARRLANESSISGTPQVSFRGFPFLTQVFAGDYRDVRVHADVAVGRVHDMRLVADLKGVHAPISDLVSQKIDALPVDDINGTATISYDELIRAAGISGATITPESDALRVRTMIPVAGRQLDVIADVNVQARDGGLSVNARHVTVDGAPAPANVVSLVNKQLNFQLRLQGLPFDLTLTNVRVGPNGVILAAQAHDVVLHSSGLAP